jgi:RNase P subunit RPR2
LVTLKAKINKKVSKKPKKDPCTVCDRNLYYNSDFSRRVGLVDDDNEILGWMCPFCGSEFTEDNELVTLKIKYDGVEGKA